MPDVDPIPAGYPRVTPYLCCRDAGAAIDFYKDVFGDSILYVNLEECTSCTACYQPDVCPVGAIYSEEHLPDGTATSAKYNSEDPNKVHDHTFFVQHSRDVFAD